MPTYNSYTGVWLLPIHSLTIDLEYPASLISTTLETRSITYVNAESNSSLEIASITVPDYGNGGERIVGFTGDLTFIPPYNNFGTMNEDFDAIIRGRITAMSLTLKAQDAQPKGAQMDIAGNVWQPINDWTIKPRWVQVEMRPAYELHLHGTLSVGMFAIVDALAHRATFFGNATEL